MTKTVSSVVEEVKQLKCLYTVADSILGYIHLDTLLGTIYKSWTYIYFLAL